MKSKIGNLNYLRVTFLAVVAFIAIGVVVYFLYDYIQYKVIAKEVEKINKERKVDMQIKSNASHQNLEKAIKEYANEYYSNINELKILYAKDDLKLLLGVDNLKTDKPQFTKSKNIISNFIKEQKQINDKLQPMVADEFITQIADKYELTGKKRRIYFSTLNLKEDATKISEIVVGYQKYAEAMLNILDFLKDNQNKWTIDDKKIIFNNVNLLNRYNELIKTQKELQADLKTKLSTEKMEE